MGDAGIGKTALLADVLAEGRRSSHHPDQRCGIGDGTRLRRRAAVVRPDCLVASIGYPSRRRRRCGSRWACAKVTAPDRLLVGLAVLTLLGDAGAERPTVCIIDDAQWVDRASLQALTFAARRLLADPVVMIFATRTPGADHELDGLPELNLGGLTHIRRPRTAHRGDAGPARRDTSARTSWPKRTEIRWRCSNFTTRWPPRSWQADTGWRTAKPVASADRASIRPTPA